jgi:hypothetical protein
MRDYQREGIQPETALEALRETYTNPDLTRFVSSFIGPNPPKRKEDMLAVLAGLLEGDHLRLAWEKLDPTDKAKAAQTVWSDTGFFDREKFDAMREKPTLRGDASDDEDEPDDDDDVAFGFDRGTDRKKKPSLLKLIMPHGVMPREIQQRLRKFVPKPPPSAIAAQDAPPATVELPSYSYNSKTRSYDRGTEAVPVVIREMERAALNDVMAVLRLVDAGKVAVSEKNHWPTPAALRQIGQILEGGDYYPDEKSDAKQSDDPDEEPPGPIRAFAWPLLLQAGKLAQVRGSRLELTKTGRAALVAPSHETLRALWEHWVKSDLLDELRRINVIRGQTGKGQRNLTDPALRRDAIAAALRESPLGQWALLNEFSRHMRAGGHEFQVSSDPWTLYIFDAQYGSLGYEGYGGWNILQFRYLLSLLMEYASTLGLIDIAFIPPSGARSDYGGLWGTDDLPFFSRYDGLLFFRLNPLGAYVLGLKDSYSPPPVQARQVIRVNPNLEVTAIGPLSSADVLLLDTFAENTGDQVWRLDPPRILDAEAAGRGMNELIAFLESASGAEFPEPVETFFAELTARANATQDLGPARLIGCADPGLATFIANHPTTAKLCSLASPDRLVVASRDDAAFHRALRKLGFVPRRPTSDA